VHRSEAVAAVTDGTAAAIGGRTRGHENVLETPARACRRLQSWPVEANALRGWHAAHPPGPLDALGTMLSALWTVIKDVMTAI